MSLPADSMADFLWCRNCNFHRTCAASNALHGFYDLPARMIHVMISGVSEAVELPVASVRGSGPVATASTCEHIHAINPKP